MWDMLFIDMKILRSGANRDNGLTVIADADDEHFGKSAYTNIFFGAGTNDKAATLLIGNMASPERQGEYNYWVELDARDLAAVLQQFAEKGLQEAQGEIADALGPVKVHMLRLLLCAEGHKS